LTSERVERRLSAILAADVAGYSRLMGVDEEGTLAQLKAFRKDVVDVKVTEHRGRIVKTTGDGMLVEFASAVDAARCAIEVQRAIAARNFDVPNERRIEFRIGIHVGDIIADEDDIFGDSVNIAARLEGIADPGGICISGLVFEHVDGKLDVNFRTLGRQTLKNIAKPLEAYAVILNNQEQAHVRNLSTANLEQKIKYCRAADGVRLAYSVVGSGPPLIKSANWLNHLEYDWELPLYHYMLESFAKENALIRYDARGNGLSDWDVAEVSLDAWVSDLEAVVKAVGVTRFPLFGFSQGCAVSIAYAVRNPERVSRLVL
jgi:class 3 adenylate cyclase